MSWIHPRMMPSVPIRSFAPPPSTRTTALKPTRPVASAVVHGARLHFWQRTGSWIVWPCIQVDVGPAWVGAELPGVADDLGSQLHGNPDDGDVDHSQHRIIGGIRAGPVDVPEGEDVERALGVGAQLGRGQAFHHPAACHETCHRRVPRAGRDRVRRVLLGRPVNLVQRHPGGRGGQGKSDRADVLRQHQPMAQVGVREGKSVGKK